MKYCDEDDNLDISMGEWLTCLEVRNGKFQSWLLHQQRSNVLVYHTDFILCLINKYSENGDGSPLRFS